MNYVYCSDLKNYQVIGTFLELLYHLKNKNDELPIPIVIVGDRDADKLPSLKELLFNKLGIKNGIYRINSEIEINDEIEIKTRLLVQNVGSLGELQLIKHDEINIGTGIVSSIISKYRCTEPSLKKHYQELINYTQQSILFLESFKQTISEKINTDDTVYIYNGRHYNTYPQSLFCEKIGCNVLYYERMNDYCNLKIQKPRIHDFLSTSRIVKDLWEKTNHPEKEELGELYFEKNMKNQFTRNFSKKFKTDKEIVSFFTSSEDEYASLDPRICLSDIFDSQRSAFERLIKWAESQERYTLVVRLHPNQENTCSKDYNYWHRSSGKNVRILPSHSKVDTYDLINQSTKVITFLSTVGIEATRFGIPSIILGNTMYKGLDAVYEPASIEELNQLLTYDIKAKDKSNTTAYGYYNVKHGPSLGFLAQTGLNSFEDYSDLLDSN